MKKKKRTFKRTNKIKSYKKIKIKFVSKIISLLFLIPCYISLIKYNDFPKLPELTEKISSTSDILKEIKAFEEKVASNLSMKTYEEFYSLNSQNKLIEENIKFEKSNSPEVSIVIIAHNLDQCIHRVLRSVQNQSLKNLEIIIVDDCSTDNTTEVIKQFQKEDPRIILLEHDSNYGPIKSRSDGIKSAKGKSILPF